MHPLDNPVWQSLNTRHLGLARVSDGVARYPADVAPFLAVDKAQAAASGALATLVDPGESLLIVGPAPAVDAGWELELLEPIAQMVCEQRIAPVSGDGFIELEAKHRDDAQRLVTELTNASLDGGKLPFLHVSNRNLRAKALYQRLGYARRIDINLWSLKRLPTASLVG